MSLEIQSLDVISVNIWQILISLVNLVLIFLILKKILYKPVRETLKQRQNAVDKIYDDANSARNAAISEKAEYDEKLSHAHDEATEIVSSARERAQRVGDEIVNDANRRAAQLMKRADDEIAGQRKKAMNEIKDEISGLSVDIAEKVIGREINESDNKSLIDEFISGIGDDNG